MRRGISEFQNFQNILFKMYIFQKKIRRNTKSLKLFENMKTWPINKGIKGTDKN